MPSLLSVPTSTAVSIATYRSEARVRLQHSRRRGGTPVQPGTDAVNLMVMLTDTARDESQSKHRPWAPQLKHRPANNPISRRPLYAVALRTLSKPQRAKWALIAPALAEGGPSSTQLTARSGLSI